MNHYQLLLISLTYTMFTHTVQIVEKPTAPQAMMPQRYRPAPLALILWHRRDTYRRPPTNIRRFIPEQFTTSVIIPCYYKHASLLRPLITQYAQQTVLPDEVVISLSQYQRVADETIKELVESSWPFQVTLILVSDKQFAGENRNTACYQAMGDVFI